MDWCLVERLESRVLLSVDLVGHVLTVRGTSLADTLTISEQGGSIVVAQNGKADRSFAGDGVDRIVIRGLSGNDRITVNAAVPAEIHGGDGNDTIRGGAGNDSIWGERGSDQLYGLDGDDRLFGGQSVDTLRGGAGRDGLMGGDGADVEFGEGGIDRFLAQSGDRLRDLSLADARLNLKDVRAKWTEAEAASVDRAFAALVEYTGTAAILRLKDGGDLTFERWKSLGGDTLSDNDSVGTIRFADSAFDPLEDADLTAFHEMGHNWDQENVRWREFMNLSGWLKWDQRTSLPIGYKRGTDTSEGWIYLASAERKFAYSYGKTNPYEDFATAFEEYYGDSPHQRWQAKWQFVDDFLSSFAG